MAKKTQELLVPKTNKRTLVLKKKPVVKEVSPQQPSMIEQAIMMLAQGQAKTTEMLEKQNELLQSIAQGQNKTEEPAVFAPKKINEMSYKIVFKVMRAVRDYEHGTVSHENPDRHNFATNEKAMEYGIKTYGMGNFDVMQERHPHSITD